MCLSVILRHGDCTRDGDTSADGCALGTVCIRTAMQRQLPGNGSHYSLLICFLQYPVRQMKKKRERERDRLNSEVNCRLRYLVSASFRLKLSKAEFCVLRKPNTGCYCSSMLADSDIRKRVAKWRQLVLTGC